MTSLKMVVLPPEVSSSNLENGPSDVLDCWPAARGKSSNPIISIGIACETIENKDGIQAGGSPIPG